MWFNDSKLLFWIDGTCSTALFSAILYIFSLACNIIYPLYKQLCNFQKFLLVATINALHIVAYPFPCTFVPVWLISLRLYNLPRKTLRCSYIQITIPNFKNLWGFKVVSDWHPNILDQFTDIQSKTGDSNLFLIQWWVTSLLDTIKK